jgi:hypothetical protein
VAHLGTVQLTIQSLAKEGTIITILGWLNNQITSPSFKEEASHVGLRLIYNPPKQRASRMIVVVTPSDSRGDMTKAKINLHPNGIPSKDDNLLSDVDRNHP